VARVRWTDVLGWGARMDSLPAFRPVLAWEAEGKPGLNPRRNRGSRMAAAGGADWDSGNPAQFKPR